MLLVTIRYLWLLNEEFCPAPRLAWLVFWVLINLGKLGHCWIV